MLNLSLEENKCYIANVSARNCKVQSNNCLDNNNYTKHLSNSFKKLYLLRKKRDKDKNYKIESNYKLSNMTDNKNYSNINFIEIDDCHIESDFNNIVINDLNTINKNEKIMLNIALKNNNVRLASSTEGNLYIKANYNSNLNEDNNMLLDKLNSLGYELLEVNDNNNELENNLIYEDFLDEDNNDINDSDLDGKSIDYSDESSEYDKEDSYYNLNYNNKYLNNKYFKKLKLIQKRMNEEYAENNNNIYSMNYVSDDCNDEDL